jgi:hypothetical protein
MKLIAPTLKTAEKDNIGKAVDQVKQLLQIGKTDEYAEDAIVAHFMRGLDNRFIMLRNLQLDDTGEACRPILIGPAGIYLLNISHIKGVFKAKDDTWWEMEKTSQKYRPSRPNLIKQTKDHGKKLAQILDTHGKSHPEIIPILIFANPGVNIERSNPAIRILLMDGVDSFIDSLMYGEEALQETEINYLADSLEIMSNPERAVPLGEGEDFFGKDLQLTEKKAPLTLPNIPMPTELPIPAVEEKFKLSKTQWIIVVVLMFLTIIVLFVSILFALKIF